VGEKMEPDHPRDHLVMGCMYWPALALIYLRRQPLRNFVWRWTGKDARGGGRHSQAGDTRLAKK